MKRVGHLITLLLVASLPLFAEHVDPETARKVATTFLNNNGAKATQLTDLSKAAGFPNLYIFTTEEGFVIMAADDCVKPILGYSLTGAFVVEDLPENVSSWLQGYDDEIQYAIEHHIKSAADIKQTWNDLILGKAGAAKTTIVKDALIETSWGQDTPFNNLCPYDSVDNRRTLTGCVATAMAQIMRYWGHPVQGTGSHSYIPATHPKHGKQTVNFGGTTYLWSNMPNALSPSSTPEQINAVATLMYHCGVSVEMDYDYWEENTSHSGSGANTINVMWALETYFSYAPCMQYKSKSNYSEAEWIAMLKRELNEGRPMQYRGNRSGGGGHSFVCDGYDSDNKFHFNWGWNGNFNGFYTISTMCPNAPYTLNQAAIFGIEPLSSLSAPTLSVALNQNAFILTWDAVEGAVSYTVYRNNEPIATVNGVSYTDDDPNLTFGKDYEYYVRAVSSETTSNPSNSYQCQYLFHDLVPSHLTAVTESNNVNLEWDGVGGQTLDLHYSNGSPNYMWGEEGENGTYWGHKYPSSLLRNLEGMYLTAASNYVYFTGTYTCCIYKGILDNDTYSFEALTDPQSYTHNESSGIVNKTFSFSPIPIDGSNDLWVVFHANSSILYPALADLYEGQGQNDAKRMSNTLERLASSSIEEPLSWLIHASITDGTYTYNLYDNGVLVNAEPISETSYALTELDDGLHQFNVKTSYYGGESDASSTANITVGNTGLETLVLENNDLMIVASNSALTVTGAITNANPANLIIEEGGQLIHPSSAVEATLKKSINGYGNDNTVKTGWYTIASPVDGYNTGIAITATEYDLYAYHEPSQVWLNQKVPANNITSFAEGYGLLYANSSDQSLDFAGSMIATDDEIAVPLSYSEAIGDLKGYNLMGNPFTRNLGSGDITIGGTALTTYYVVEGGSELETRNIATYPIKPGQGFFVQATGLDQALVFNPSSKRSQDDYKPSFIRIEAGNDLFTDRAYVQLGEGNILHKMTLRDDLPKVSVTKDQLSYSAIVVDETASEIPIHFKAAENGSYTIRINAENTGLGYLHLIDNLTGADIDLLQTQSYAFEATASDYESRFRLIFSANGNPNGNSADLEGSVTHVMDVTGRIVGTSIHENMKPGVYILRTVNGNETKTEKIIIK